MTNRPEDNGDKVHTPEYVLLDAEESSEKREETGDAFQTMRGIGAKKFPWSMRIVIILAFVPVLLAAIVTLFALAFTFALAFITFFQSSEMNNNLKKAWETFKSVLAVILGLIIAIFSPAFGFSIIMLYFMLHQQEGRSAYVRRFFQSRFK